MNMLNYAAQAVFRFMKDNIMNGLRRHVVGHFLKSLDEKQLKMKLFERSLEIQDLDLEVQSVNKHLHDQNVPFQIEEAYMGKCRWQFPWRIVFEDIFMCFVTAPPLASKYGGGSANAGVPPPNPPQDGPPDDGDGSPFNGVHPAIDFPSESFAQHVSPSTSIPHRLHNSNSPSNRNSPSAASEMKRYNMDDIIKIVSYGMQSAMGSLEFSLKNICLCLYVPHNISSNETNDKPTSCTDSASFTTSNSGPGYVLRLHIESVRLVENTQGTLSIEVSGITLSLIPSISSIACFRYIWREAVGEVLFTTCTPAALPADGTFQIGLIDSMNSDTNGKSANNNGSGRKGNGNRRCGATDTSEGEPEAQPPQFANMFEQSGGRKRASDYCSQHEATEEPFAAANVFPAVVTDGGYQYDVCLKIPELQVALGYAQLKNISAMTTALHTVLRQPERPEAKLDVPCSPEPCGCSPAPSSSPPSPIACRRAHAKPNVSWCSSSSSCRSCYTTNTTVLDPSHSRMHNRPHPSLSPHRPHMFPRMNLNGGSSPASSIHHDAAPPQPKLRVRLWSWLWQVLTFQDSLMADTPAHSTCNSPPASRRSSAPNGENGGEIFDRGPTFDTNSTSCVQNGSSCARKQSDTVSHPYTNFSLPFKRSPSWRIQLCAQRVSVSLVISETYIPRMKRMQNGKYCLNGWNSHYLHFWATNTCITTSSPTFHIPQFSKEQQQQLSSKVKPVAGYRRWSMSVGQWGIDMNLSNCPSVGSLHTANSDKYKTPKDSHMGGLPGLLPSDAQRCAPSIEKNYDQKTATRSLSGSVNGTNHFMYHSVVAEGDCNKKETLHCSDGNGLRWQAPEDACNAGVAQNLNTVESTNSHWANEVLSETASMMLHGENPLTNSAARTVATEMARELKHGVAVEVAEVYQSSTQNIMGKHSGSSHSDEGMTAKNWLERSGYSTSQLNCGVSDAQYCNMQTGGNEKHAGGLHPSEASKNAEVTMESFDINKAHFSWKSNAQPPSDSLYLNYGVGGEAMDPPLWDDIARCGSLSENVSCGALSYLSEINRKNNTVGRSSGDPSEGLGVHRFTQEKLSTSCDVHNADARLRLKPKEDEVQSEILFFPSKGNAPSNRKAATESLRNNSAALAAFCQARDSVAAADVSAEKGGLSPPSTPKTERSEVVDGSDEDALLNMKSGKGDHQDNVGALNSSDFSRESTFGTRDMYKSLYESIPNGAALVGHSENNADYCSRNMNPNPKRPSELPSLSNSVTASYIFNNGFSNVGGGDKCHSEPFDSFTASKCLRQAEAARIAAQVDPRIFPLPSDAPASSDAPEDFSSFCLYPLLAFTGVTPDMLCYGNNTIFPVFASATIPFNLPDAEDAFWNDVSSIVNLEVPKNGGGNDDRYTSDPTDSSYSSNAGSVPPHLFARWTDIIYGEPYSNKEVNNLPREMPTAREPTVSCKKCYCCSDYSPSPCCTEEGPCGCFKNDTSSREIKDNEESGTVAIEVVVQPAVLDLSMTSVQVLHKVLTRAGEATGFFGNCELPPLCQNQQPKVQPSRSLVRASEPDSFLNRFSVELLAPCIRTQLELTAPNDKHSFVDPSCISGANDNQQCGDANQVPERSIQRTFVVLDVVGLKAVAPLGNAVVRPAYAWDSSTPGNTEPTETRFLFCPLLDVQMHALCYLFYSNTVRSWDLQPPYDHFQEPESVNSHLLFSTVVKPPLFTLQWQGHQSIPRRGSSISTSSRLRVCFGVKSPVSPVTTNQCAEYERDRCSRGHSKNCQERSVDFCQSPAIHGSLSPNRRRSWKSSIAPGAQLEDIPLDDAPSFFGQEYDNCQDNFREASFTGTAVSAERLDDTRAGCTDDVKAKAAEWAVISCDRPTIPIAPTDTKTGFFPTPFERSPTANEPGANESIGGSLRNMEEAGGDQKSSAHECNGFYGLPLKHQCTSSNERVAMECSEHLQRCDKFPRGDDSSIFESFVHISFCKVNLNSNTGKQLVAAGKNLQSLLCSTLEHDKEPFDESYEGTGQLKDNFIPMPCSVSPASDSESTGATPKSKLTSEENNEDSSLAKHKATHVLHFFMDNCKIELSEGKQGKTRDPSKASKSSNFKRKGYKDTLIMKFVNTSFHSHCSHTGMQLALRLGGFSIGYGRHPFLYTWRSDLLYPEKEDETQARCLLWLGGNQNYNDYNSAIRGIPNRNCLSKPSNSNNAITVCLSLQWQCAGESSPGLNPSGSSSPETLADGKQLDISTCETNAVCASISVGWISLVCGKNAVNGMNVSKAVLDSYLVEQNCSAVKLEKCNAGSTQLPGEKSPIKWDIRWSADLGVSHVLMCIPKPLSWLNYAQEVKTVEPSLDGLGWLWAFHFDKFEIGAKSPQATLDFDSIDCGLGLFEAHVLDESSKLLSAAHLHTAGEAGDLRGCASHTPLISSSSSDIFAHLRDRGFANVLSVKDLSMTYAKGPLANAGAVKNSAEKKESSGTSVRFAGALAAKPRNATNVNAKTSLAFFVGAINAQLCPDSIRCALRVVNDVSLIIEKGRIAPEVVQFCDNFNINLYGLQQWKDGSFAPHPSEWPMKIPAVAQGLSSKARGAYFGEKGRCRGNYLTGIDLHAFHSEHLPTVAYAYGISKTGGKTTDPGDRRASSDPNACSRGVVANEPAGQNRLFTVQYPVVATPAFVGSSDLLRPMNLIENYVSAEMPASPAVHTHLVPLHPQSGGLTNTSMGGQTTSSRPADTQWREKHGESYGCEKGSWRKILREPSVAQDAYISSGGGTNKKPSPDEVHHMEETDEKNRCLIKQLYDKGGDGEYDGNVTWLSDVLQLDIVNDHMVAEKHTPPQFDSLTEQSSNGKKSPEDLRLYISCKVDEVSISLFTGSHFPNELGTRWREDLIEIIFNGVSAKIGTFNLPASSTTTVEPLSKRMKLNIQDFRIKDKVRKSSYEYVMRYYEDDTARPRRADLNIASFTVDEVCVIPSYPVPMGGTQTTEDDEVIVGTDNYLIECNNDNHMPTLLEYSFDFKILPLWLTLDQRTLDGLDVFNQQVKVAAVTERSFNPLSDEEDICASSSPTNGSSISDEYDSRYIRKSKCSKDRRSRCLSEGRGKLQSVSSSSHRKGKNRQKTSSSNCSGNLHASTSDSQLPPVLNVDLGYPAFPPASIYDNMDAPYWMVGGMPPSAGAGESTSYKYHQNTPPVNCHHWFIDAPKTPKDSQSSGAVKNRALTEGSAAYINECGSTVMRPVDFSQYKMQQQQIFVRSCKIHAMLLKIDYKSRTPNTAGLRNGEMKEVLNFLATFCAVEGLEVSLSPQVVHSALGVTELLGKLTEAWVKDFNRAQILRCLSGVPPIRSLYQIGSNMIDLITDIIRLSNEHLKKPNPTASEVSELSWKIVRGLAYFLKSCAVEGINLSERVLRNTHNVLVKVDKRFTPGTCPGYPASVFRREGTVPNNNSSVAVIQLFDEEEEEQNKQDTSSNSEQMNSTQPWFDNSEWINTYENNPQNGATSLSSEWALVEPGAAGYYEPTTMKEGVIQAIDCMRRGVTSASNVANRIELPRKLSLEAMQSVARLLPVFILRPILGFTEAISTTLQGVRNELDPKVRREREQKLRRPKFVDESDFVEE